MMRILVSGLTMIILFGLSGCLEDPIAETVNAQWSNSAELVTVMETANDFINSNERHAMISVDEMRTNLYNYLIIDIRPHSEYIKAHIEKSINIQPASLLAYFKTYTGNHPKIIIVCETGQYSAFVTSLLRYSGLDNVYSVNFGLAYWNRVFSDSWLQAADNSIYHDDFNRVDYFSDTVHPLPEVDYEPGVSTINEKIESRIQSILSKDISEFIVTKEFLENRYYARREFFRTMFMICYGEDSLYTGVVAEPVTWRPYYRTFGHYENTHLFKWDAMPFHTSTMLQYLPPDKLIGLYCYNGQYSAFAAAYLAILGYKVNIIKYGMFNIVNKEFKVYHTLYHPKTGKLIRSWEEDTWFTPYGFWEKDIRDYPIVTGE